MHNIEKRFSKAHNDYDQNAAPQAHIARALIARLPNDVNPARVLEIGCGTGALTTLLRDHFPLAEILATDISQAMLDKASANIGKNSSHIRFMCLDGQDLTPLSAKTFDLIISNMSVQWFSDLQASYDLWLDYLTPQGQFYASRPAPSAFCEWQKSLQALKRPTALLPFQPTSYPHEITPYKVQYPSSLSFLKTIKRSGAHTARANYKPLSPLDLKRACAYCDAQFGGEISWNYAIDYYERSRSSD